MDKVRAKQLMEAAYQDHQLLMDSSVQHAIEEVIELLDQGKLRVCEKIDGQWQTHAWVKQAIYLYFAMRPLSPMEGGGFSFYDKIPIKKNHAEVGVRVVPPAVARYGSYLEPGCILMPSYVNIGAYVGAGTLVDTFATVGSCAQIGKGVHVSGGVGIGGVLEPPTQSPVIVEDFAFIGSRCILVEGVIVESEAVLGANVVITASTPIVDVTGDVPVKTKGKIPARSVVIPGTLPKAFPAGMYQVPCALIIGKRNESTDKKTSLNEVLRTFEALGNS